MSLELAPEVENTVREYAEAEGVSINDLLARTFPPRRPPVAPDDPVLVFLNSRLREAEDASPEEEVEAESGWQSFARNMNDNRRVNGERLVYPAVEQP